MHLGRLAALAFGIVLASTTALADTPPSTTSSSPATPAPVVAGDLFVQISMLDEQSRRSDLAAEEAKARASALRAVARIARAHAPGLKTSENLEVQRGIGHIEEQVHWLDASVSSYQKQAAEYREDAQRLRDRSTRGEVATLCLPPFTIDTRGHKIWKPECF
jgi:hypothetical protein